MSVPERTGGRSGVQFFALAVVGATLLSCEGSSDPPPPEPSSTGESAPRAQVRAEAVEETVVHVPVGEFRAGSTPKEPGRDPATEPGEGLVKLGPFRIDRTLVSTAEGPRLVSQPKEAEALCAQRGGRLCTELEWERACRGPASSTYPGGDQPCTDPDCRSGFDVSQMTQYREWTASSFGKDSSHPGEPVIRGSPSRAPNRERRCARREPESALDSGERLAFRCCYGAPNAARIQEPKTTAVFEETNIELEELKKLLLSHEKTRELAKDLSLFKEDAAATVLARGPGETMGFSLTTRAVRWSPARGVRLLVVAGKSGDKTAFVVAYFLGLDPPALAGSFIMKNERGPIALAYAESIRPRMHFSGCWGCPGETGKLLFRPKETVVLLQP